MGKSPTIYAWDTGIFLAWMGAPTRADISMADLGAVVDEVDKGEATLVTSVLAYAEVLGAHHSPESIKRFKDFLNRSNVEVVNVYRAVADKVEQIRTRGCVVTPKIRIEVADATFAATAILFGANVLHTADNKLLKASKTSLLEMLETGLPIPLSKQRSAF